MFGRWLSLVLVVLCVAGAAESQEIPSISLQDLREKYALPESQFEIIEGIEVHYLDQGAGDAVVLLHGSGLNLRAWDSLAEALQPGFRVIRFDFPVAGLTAADPAQRESMGRNLEILLGLLDFLELENVSLAGASSGGIIAFRFAAQFQDRVDRLILINSGGLPRTPQTNPARVRPEMAEFAGMAVKPRAYFEAAFSYTMVGPRQPPDWLIDMAFDINRREGFANELDRFNQRFATGQPKVVLAEVKSPTLILWGRENRSLSHLDADVFEHWITGAPSLVKKYDGLGHWAYLEDPALVARDVLSFLNGDLDPQLTQTINKPYLDQQ